MASPTHPQLQVGIMRRDHEFTPTAFQHPAQGVILSAQVEDVDAAYSAVRKRGFCIAQELRDESFGMRRFISSLREKPRPSGRGGIAIQGGEDVKVADPNGLLVNLFSFP